MHTLRASSLAGLALGTLLVACSDDATPVEADAATADSGGDVALADSADAIADGGGMDTEAGDSGAEDSTPADAVPDVTQDSSSDAPATSSVTLRFRAKVGSKPFACGTRYDGQGATAVTVEPRDFRFYVSRVQLVDSAGNRVPVTLDARNPWQTPDLALLDFEDGSGACAAEGTPQTNDTITGTVPAGTYRGIVFTNSIPDAINHGDPLAAPPPLQLGAMTWGWLYGFKFVKAELAAVDVPSGDAAPGLGLLHLGSTGCTNATDAGDDYTAPPAVACTTPNHNEIHLTGFDPATSTIVADIGAIFLGTDLGQDNQCHSEGVACPPLFSALGLSFATGAVVPSQTVFRVE